MGACAVIDLAYRGPSVDRGVVDDLARVGVGGDRQFETRVRDGGGDDRVARLETRGDSLRFKRHDALGDVQLRHVGADAGEADLAGAGLPEYSGGAAGGAGEPHPALRDVAGCPVGGSVFQVTHKVARRVVDVAGTRNDGRRPPPGGDDRPAVKREIAAEGRVARRAGEHGAGARLHHGAFIGEGERRRLPVFRRRDFYCRAGCHADCAKRRRKTQVVRCGVGEVPLLQQVALDVEAVGLVQKRPREENRLADVVAALVALVLVGLEVRPEEIARVGLARQEVALQKRDANLRDCREGVEEFPVQMEAPAGEVGGQVGATDKVGFAVGDVADVAVHAGDHAAHAGSGVADGGPPAVGYPVHEEDVADVRDTSAGTVLHEAHIDVGLATVEIDAGAPLVDAELRGDALESRGAGPPGRLGIPERRRGGVRLAHVAPLRDESLVVGDDCGIGVHPEGRALEDGRRRRGIYGRVVAGVKSRLPAKRGERPVPLAVDARKGKREFAAAGLVELRPVAEDHRVGLRRRRALFHKHATRLAEASLHGIGHRRRNARRGRQKRRHPNCLHSVHCFSPWVEGWKVEG